MPRTLRSTVLALLLGTLLADPVSAAWLDSGWPQRLEITAQPGLISGGTTLTDFTLLLDLDSINAAAVFAAAKGDGSDLVLTAADGTTPLGLEVVTYDAGAERAELWFKTPTLSPTDNVFYLYFGNADTTVTRAQGEAWTDDHLGVFHFDQDPSLGILEDSSPHNNFGTTGTPAAMWTSGDVTPGQIGQGWLMNGETHFIDADNVQSAEQTFTISAWFALSNLNSDANFAFSAESGFWHVSAKRNGAQMEPDIATVNGFIKWEPTLTDNDIHHFKWTLDAEADTARFYFDGVEQDVQLRFAPNPPFQVYTGEQILGNVGLAGPLFQGNPFDLHEGTVDEFQIYQGIRDPDWIRTEYDNQADPINFYTYQVQSQVTAVGPSPGTLVRMAVSPNPFRGATDIVVETGRASLEVSVFNIAGRRVRMLRPHGPVDGTLALRWDGRDGQGLRVSNGTYFVRAKGADVLALKKVVLIR